MTRARGSVGGQPTAEIRPGSGTELDQCTSEIGSIGLGTLAGGPKSARANLAVWRLEPTQGSEADLAPGRNRPQIQGGRERSACAPELLRTERCLFRPLRCFRRRREPTRSRASGCRRRARAVGAGEADACEQTLVAQNAKAGWRSCTEWRLADHGEISVELHRKMTEHSRTARADWEFLGRRVGAVEQVGRIDRCSSPSRAKPDVTALHFIS